MATSAEAPACSRHPKNTFLATPWADLDETFTVPQSSAAAVVPLGSGSAVRLGALLGCSSAKKGLMGVHSTKPRGKLATVPVDEVFINHKV